MKQTTISYSNMWGESHAFHANYIVDCFPFLAPHYRFTASAAPEVAFFSAYGYIQNRLDGARRLIYVGEPGEHFKLGGKISPGVYEAAFYQFGITCDLLDPSPNHAYMPQGLIHLNLYNKGVASLIRDGSPPPVKEFFCDFTYSNGNSLRRIEFFEKLNARKRVESCGHVRRNNNALASAAYSKQGYLLKQAFQAKCKFSIAMENNVFAGYNTEKLTDPFIARSVPIYWGDPMVTEFWNPDAFIRVDDFENDDAAIDYILKVDADDALYQKYQNAPPFRGNQVPPELSDARYLELFKQWIENP